MSRKKVHSAVDTTPHDEPVKPLSLPLELIPAKQEVQPDTTNDHRSLDFPHTSYSQISMYMRCPQQYMFRYKLGLKERPKVSMALGSGGHTALEFNNRRKMARGEDAPVEELLQVASDQMDFQLNQIPPSEYEKDVEPGSTKDRFIEATRVYRLRDAPKIQPIAAELDFILDVNDLIPDDEKPQFPLRVINGKIDIIQRDDVFFGPAESTPIAVHDYKYVSRRKNIEEINLTPQLTLYATVIKQRTGKWPTNLALRQMLPGSFAKNPKPEDGPNSEVISREDKYMTPEALERRSRRLLHQIVTIEKNIYDDRYYPTDDPKTCSWCGYRDRCQDSLVTDLQAATIRATTTPPLGATETDG